MEHITSWLRNDVRIVCVRLFIAQSDRVTSCEASGTQSFVPFLWCNEGTANSAVLFTKPPSGKLTLEELLDDPSWLFKERDNDFGELKVDQGGISKGRISVEHTIMKLIALVTVLV